MSSDKRKPRDPDPTPTPTPTPDLTPKSTTPPPFTDPSAYLEWMAARKNPFEGLFLKTPPSFSVSEALKAIIQTNNSLTSTTIPSPQERRREMQLRTELDRVRQQLEETVERIAKNEHAREESASKLKEELDRYRAIEGLSFLYSKVSSDAQSMLIADKSFASKFLEGESNAFVVSIDIRRSTELMLKARSAKQFAAFIFQLCVELEAIIKNCGGVFDTFTGDGVLAFFPEFYSGEHAGYLALLAANLAHKAFRDHYLKCRNAFTTVLKDTGLGIGIDFGKVHLLKAPGGLTVVGPPVVYACRLSGAPAGRTFLNQPAFEQIGSLGGHCYAREAELEIKHEGPILCYDVELTNLNFNPAAPAWKSSAPPSEDSDNSPPAQPQQS